MGKEISELNRKDLGKIVDGTSKGAVIGGIVGSCAGPIGTIAGTKAGAYVGGYIGSIDAFDAWEEVNEMKEDFVDLYKDVKKDISDWWDRL